MTATVRIFAVSGLTRGEVVSGTNLAYDSVQFVKWPLLGRDLLSCDTSTADISEAASAPSNTKMALVQVQSGKEVYYEVIPENFDVTDASSTSPILSGTNMIHFGPGWRLSVKEVA